MKTQEDPKTKGDRTDVTSRLFLALLFSPEYSHAANSLLELPFYSEETTRQSPSKIKLPGDFPGGRTVKISPSNARCKDFKLRSYTPHG